MQAASGLDSKNLGQSATAAKKELSLDRPSRSVRHRHKIRPDIFLWPSHRVPAEKSAAGRPLGNRFWDRADTADEPKVGHGKKAIVYSPAKMQHAKFPRRHFDLAFTNNLERQNEIESGNRATVFPFGAEAQIPGQDGNWGIKSFRISAFTATSGCQDCLAVVFEKLCRMHHTIYCSFDPQSILLVRISGSKGLARQCLRLGLALAGQSVLPGGSICGWNWPFCLCDRRADQHAN